MPHSHSIDSDQIAKYEIHAYDMFAPHEGRRLIRAGIISPPQFLLLQTIHGYATAKGVGCFAATKKIAFDCGWNERQCQKHIQAMKTMGLLKEKEDQAYYGGKPQRTLYVDWTYIPTLNEQERAAKVY